MVALGKRHRELFEGAPFYCLLESNDGTTPFEKRLTMSVAKFIKQSKANVQAITDVSIHACGNCLLPPLVVQDEVLLYKLYTSPYGIRALRGKGSCIHTTLLSTDHGR